MNVFSTFQQAAMSPTTRQLGPLLYDDEIQVLSTFELNKVASLTYGDLVCDEIFEIMGGILSRPMQYTPLTLQKALVMVKHMMVYGAEPTVNHAMSLCPLVTELQEFNTVIMAQKQQGAMAMWQRIQGGGVDKGGPVRDAAVQVNRLLSNVNELRRIRNNSADPNSLVPVGDNRTAFVTDEVRHHLLKQRIEEQQRIQTRSNLAKSDNGWGSGYTSKDGKSVVGAAHGIEEMLKQAQKEKQKFTDDGTGTTGYISPDQMLAMMEQQGKRNGSFDNDLLSYGAPATSEPTTVDLLDFGAETTTAPPASSGDLLGGDGSDLLGGGGSTYENAASDFLGVAAGMYSQPSQGSDLLGNGYGATGIHDAFAPLSTPAPAVPQTVDPFASISQTSNSNSGSGANELLSLGATMGAMSLGGSSTGLSAPSSSTTMKNGPLGTTMNSTGLGAPAEDRFAALDALGAPTSASAKAAENRILGNGNGGVMGGLSNGRSSMSGSIGGSVGSHNDHVGGRLSMNGGGSIGDTHSFAMNPGKSLSMPAIPAPQPNYMSSSQSFTPAGVGSVAQTYGDDDGDDDDDNPWVMGGTAGMGLQPTGPAPGSAPPPPPAF